METKRFLVSLAILTVMTASTFAAEETWGGYFANTIPTCVQLLPCQGNDDDCHPKGHRQPTLLPELAYEGNTFVLAVPYVLNDVTIVIRDEDGLVLYYDVVSTITDYYMFLLTNDVIADMYSIELYYGDYHLYGEF